VNKKLSVVSPPWRLQWFEALYRSFSFWTEPAKPADGDEGWRAALAFCRGW